MCYPNANLHFKIAYGIIVVGASAGIGAETAAYLSHFQPFLVLTGRNKINLEAVARQCEQRGLTSEKVTAVMKRCHQTET